MLQCTLAPLGSRFVLGGLQGTAARRRKHNDPFCAFQTHPPDSRDRYGICSSPSPASAGARCRDLAACELPQGRAAAWQVFDCVWPRASLAARVWARRGATRLGTGSAHAKRGCPHTVRGSGFQDPAWCKNTCNAVHGALQCVVQRAIASLLERLNGTSEFYCASGAIFSAGTSLSSISAAQALLRLECSAQVCI